MSSLQSTLSNLPSKPGVYLFKNQNGDILYIGKAINLRNRVRNYFTQSGDGRTMIGQLVPQIATIDTILVTSEFEALVLESSLIRKHQPKYNTVAKDDKHPLYIIITKETFPKIKTLRKNQLQSEKHYIYGPFPSAKTVRQVLKTLRRITPFCTAKYNKGRPCFYSHIGLCNPCPREILEQPPEQLEKLKRRYQRQVRLLRKLLEGESNYVIDQLHKHMNQASEDQEFEMAAQYRDAINHLHTLLKPLHPVNQFVNNPSLASEIRQYSLEELQSLLNDNGIVPSVTPLERIEGYDISTFQGRETTGSMVVFYQGEPATGEYRRFKIKPAHRHADTESMFEMLSRRLHPRHHQDWPLPDLIMVDGGITQIGAAQRALVEHNLNIPLIGLAKREEIILIPQADAQTSLNTKDHPRPKQLKLPPQAPALQVIQHLRDEAHRFARKYHRLLRDKQILQNVNKRR